MKKLEHQQWWPELVSLKDEMSLRELGSRFGVTPSAVMKAFARNGITRKSAPPGPRKYRQARSLPPEAGSPRAPKAKGRRRGPKSKVEPFHDIVGVEPDSVVAQRAGVTVAAVRNYRKRFGIVAVSRSSARKTSASTTRVARQVSRPMRAYAVSVKGREVGVVLGQSLTDAAAKADTVGEVTELRLLGVVLS